MYMYGKRNVVCACKMYAMVDNSGFKLMQPGVLDILIVSVYLFFLPKSVQLISFLLSYCSLSKNILRMY